MVTTKQKPIGDSQKIKKGETEHITMEWPVGRNKKKKKYIGTTKLREVIKMALVSPYISIITLSVNGLNSPIRKVQSGWMDFKKIYDPTISCL